MLIIFDGQRKVFKRGNSSKVEYSLAKARVEGSNPFFRFFLGVTTVKRTTYMLVA